MGKPETMSTRPAIPSLGGFRHWRILVAVAATIITSLRGSAAAAPSHTFAASPDGFVLDGKPFVYQAAEIHPARIPPAYWRHRLMMIKAMGLPLCELKTLATSLEDNTGTLEPLLTKAADLADTYAANAARKAPPIK